MNHPREKAAATLPLVRCAVYTRKSTEEGLEQEFNSLDAQRESAQAFIRLPALMRTRSPTLKVALMGESPRPPPCSVKNPYRVQPR
jgi:hypothetical protein